MTNNLKKVLLIEDDKVDQMAFKRLVQDQKLPYEYEIAGSVQEGKQKLSNTIFDVVITDYMLSDGTGFDVFKDCHDSPIIVTTGAGNEEIAISAMKQGAYDYLIKDTDLNYLKVLPVTVEKAVERKKSEEQIRMLSHSLMSISDSVYISDMQGRLIFVNKSFSKTYGYGDEILGENCSVLWEGVPGEKEMTENLGKDDFRPGSDFYHVRKDKQVFPVSLSKSIIRDEKGVEKAIVAVARDITEKKRAEEEREKMFEELQKAMEKVKIMSGMLPICASCKKIRDDSGYWNQIEAYIKDHSDAEFSHSICPDCLVKLYPELYGDEKE